MVRHTDNWGALMEVLREFDPAGTILSQGLTADFLRVYLRWLFATLEAFTFCLKRITVEHVATKSVPISRRESEVLAMIKEPPLAGLPAPRRVQAGMRESLGVALNVYSRARGSEGPLGDARLPQIFVDASLIHDRLMNPESPEDLQITKDDIGVIVEFIRWFESIRQWLYADRAAEIKELKRTLLESNDAIRRMLSNPEP